jgi:hypothetical protein
MLRAAGRHLKKDALVSSLNVSGEPPRTLPGIALSPGNIEKSVFLKKLSLEER